MNNPTTAANKTEAQVIFNNLNNFNNGRGGRFLYIGICQANAGNVVPLYQQGWIGTMIQHSNIRMKALRESFGKDARIRLYEVLVNELDSKTTLYESLDGVLSTTDLRAKKKFNRDFPLVHVSELSVKTMSMRNLLSTDGADIDLLLLDDNAVSNAILFKTLPSDFLHRLKCIFIRHERAAQYYVDFLTSYNFRVACINENNLVMVKNS